MEHLIAVVLGAVGSILAYEICAHADPVARWLIIRAVARLPEPQRNVRLEEWLAHLNETPGAIRKLLHGVGCWFGAPAIGRALAGGVRVRTRRTSSVVNRIKLGLSGRFLIAELILTSAAVLVIFLFKDDAVRTAAVLTRRVGAAVARGVAAILGG
jgi:hypothetical protein